MARLLFTILLSTVLFFAKTQTNTQNIYGRVVDAESENPLFGATIEVLNTENSFGVISDLDGYFELKNIPVGRISIRVSYLGYEPKTYPEILIYSGKATKIEVKLKESLSEVQEITVVAKRKSSSTLEVKNDMATVSAMSYSLEQSSRFAASLNDPSRLVLSFPGVRNQGDVQNGISIRGNTPSSLLWNLEGLEIQSPNHFAREGSLGAINMVSSNVLKSVDFFSAAFPAQYGNAGSGVFDLKTREGNANKHEFSLTAGIMGLEASAEGPFSKKYKGSFLLSYRYSTLSIFNKLGYDLIGNNAPVYQDVNYKINLPTKKLGQFQVFGLFGDSKISPFNIESDGNWEDKYRLAVLAISNKKSISQKTLLNTAIMYSQSKGDFYEQYTRSRINGQYYKGYNNTITTFPIIEKRLQFDVKTNTKVNAKHSFKTGLNVTYLDFNQQYFDVKEKYKYDPITDQHTLKSIEKDSAVAIAQSFQIKAFMQQKYRVNDKLSFNAGLHFISLNYTKFFSVEPRVGMKFWYGKNHLLSAGIGMHSRLEPLGYYATYGKYPTSIDFSVSDFNYSYGTPNHYLQATKSLHFVLGNTLQLKTNLKFKTEAYFQYLYQIPVLKDNWITYFYYLPYDYASINEQYPTIYTSNVDVQQEYVNKGKGVNYGIDLSLEKSFSKNYYFLINSSFYQSKYKTPYTKELYNVNWLNTRYNGNFIQSITAGKDFKLGKKKNNIISTNFRTIWAGNNRETNYLSSIPFDKKLENYFRLDSRIAYIRNKEKYTWTLSIDLQNMTNRINEASNSQINSVGFLPILNYKVQF